MAVIKPVLLLLIVLLSAFCIEAQRSRRFFRRDYTYLENTEAFYKIHTIHRTWQEARKKCTDEGASLFYAEDDSEAREVITFWNKTQPQFYWVWTGVSDLLVEDVFETVDGRPILDVFSTWSPGEPNNANGVEHCAILRREGVLNDDDCKKKFPSICKKTLETLEWNKECDMPNPEYIFNKDLGRCYKFHTKPKNWTEAMTACSNEQSYLAIINSQAEADFFVQLLEKTNRNNVSGLSMNGVVYLGFHNRDGDGWKTIRGTSMEDSGYAKWGNQQPDGGAKETCGSMFFTGTLNDLECVHTSFFICEHDIGGTKRRRLYLPKLNATEDTAKRLQCWLPEDNEIPDDE